MSQYFWVAGAFGILGLLVSCAGLAVGASMLWSVERRAATFLWIAMGLFLTRGIASPVMLAVMSSWANPELGVVVQWAVDAAMSISAWLVLTGALVVIARTLREPARQRPVAPGPVVR